jgi:hypothetical protein
VGQGLLITEASRSHSDTPHSVELLWTNDQPDAETSTWQHRTHKRQTSMAPTGFEPAIPASVRPQTHVFKMRGHWDRLPLNTHNVNLPPKGQTLSGTEQKSCVRNLNYFTLFSIMMALYTWAETHCSKTLLVSRCRQRLPLVLHIYITTVKSHLKIHTQLCLYSNCPFICRSWG